jgi:hypothetical protein
MRAEFFPAVRKRVKANMVEEYCWAITLSEGSLTAADKFLSVLQFECQLDSVETHTSKAQRTRIRFRLT